MLGDGLLIIPAQVAKVNGEHENNVWGIMQCPEYALKCNKVFT